MKKCFALLLCACLALSLCACGHSSGLKTLTLVSAYDRSLAGTTLNVYNWGEYISEGDEGGLYVEKAFEELTGIKVNYSTYETNEFLYSKLTAGGANYDLIFPSDYMIQRLIDEDRLEPIDFAGIPNYSYIMDEYRALYYDPRGAYSVPFAIGMVGLIYNKALVADLKKQVPASWAAMWDPDYKDQILQFESPRDAFGTAQYLLGQDVNSLDKADWRAAADKLKEQVPLLQDYVSDEIYNVMGGANAILAPYYVGDFLSMQSDNPDLEFVYPDEGTNYYYDSACIPKGARNKAAAELFINFLLEPDVALANAEYNMCATPHKAVRANPAYTLRGNAYLYPETLPAVQYFEHLPNEIIRYMNMLWTEVKQK